MSSDEGVCKGSGDDGSWSAFRTRVPGKWVLAGEHAVLRGATAVALPHAEVWLSLEYLPGPDDLVVDPPEAGPILREILASLPLKSPPRGSLILHSSIPMGAGLGSSAALCVAVSRWLAEPLRLAESDLPAFATRLEDRFHGRSSGMDVAVILAGVPISFTREQGARQLGVRRLPRFTLHDCGARSRTRDCILKVETLLAEDPARARALDDSMEGASRLALEGLELFDRGAAKEGEDALAKALRQGQECYQGWGLVPEAARRLGADLIVRGALATKLTGAGGGGMVVALWSETRS